MLEVALSAVSQAAQKLKEIDGVYTSANRISIGKVVHELMSVRTAIHIVRPDLKPLQETLREQSVDVYQKIDGVLESAWLYERRGEWQKAEAAYRQTLQMTEIEHFVVMAQAGLFRCANNHG